VSAVVSTAPAPTVEPQLTAALRHRVKPLPTGEGERRHTRMVINMWWIYIVMPILFALGIYGFISWTGVQKRFLTRKTDRTAENMYDEFARGDRPPRS
jgi:hypothetical protein